MSMYPAHRGTGVPPQANGPSRLNELLDQVRSEFESQARQSEGYEHQSKRRALCHHKDPAKLSALKIGSVPCNTTSMMCTNTGNHI